MILAVALYNDHHICNEASMQDFFRIWTHGVRVAGVMLSTNWEMKPHL